MATDRFKNWKRPVLKHGVMTKWLWVAWHPENLVLGDRCDIGAFTLIQAREGVAIGERAELGSHCAIYSVSTIDGKKGRVVIGKGAKVGSHSTIMPGVTIGDGAVVGAHSFVNCDIPAGASAWGVPAKVQKEK